MVLHLNNFTQESLVTRLDEIGPVVLAGVKDFYIIASNRMYFRYFIIISP